MKEYSTLENKVYVAENVIEKSRFLAYVKGVDSVEEAVDFVAQIKKKHFDATHNCYGYVFDDKAKFSDDGEFSEPLVGRQGSRVTMRVARGSASLLPSHGRGLWPRDVMKKVSRGLSRVEAGNPGFPRLVQVTSGGFSWWL